MSERLEDPTLFDISVRWSDDDVVVAVVGEVDLLTAPAFGAALRALVDGGHRHIVVDLAGVSFIDAAGLEGIASAASLLRGRGASFAIRSPRPPVLRLLDLTHFGRFVELESTPVHVPIAPVAMRAQATADGHDPIAVALRLVTTRTQKALVGADGVSVSLVRHGQLSTVAASDETIAQMDRDQYATGEGPCVSAAAEGRRFHVESVPRESRWPNFTPRAMEGGIGSILSTPLMVATRPVGALNIYSNTERAFGREDQELAGLFATQVAGLLAEARLAPTAEVSAAAMHDALEARTIIAQAQGVVMARQGVSAEAAFASLRQAAARTGVPVRQRATELLASARREGLIGEVGP